MRVGEIILTSPALEELITPFAATFPNRADCDGYRNHCLRMLNVAMALGEEQPDRREKLV